jgi:hypothetical protein
VKKEQDGRVQGTSPTVRSSGGGNDAAAGASAAVRECECECKEVWELGVCKGGGGGCYGRA